MKHFCREASQLASDRFERDLTVVERFRFRLHLAICGMCRNYASNLKLLNRMFSAIRRQIDEEGICLPEKTRQRIAKSVHEATNSTP